MKDKNSVLCAGEQMWRSYWAGTLEDAAGLELEEHLLICDLCLEKYLEHIENINSQDCSLQLPDGFTDRIAPLPSLKDKEARNKKINLMVAYCGAASIAIFLWAGGFFDGLCGGLTTGIRYLHTAEVQIIKTDSQKKLIQHGWTQKMLEEKSIFPRQKIIPEKE